MPRSARDRPRRASAVDDTSPAQPARSSRSPYGVLAQVDGVAAAVVDHCLNPAVRHASGLEMGQGRGGDLGRLVDVGGGPVVHLARTPSPVTPRPRGITAWGPAVCPRALTENVADEASERGEYGRADRRKHCAQWDLSRIGSGLEHG